MDYEIDSEYISGVVRREVDAADNWMDADLAEEQADNLKYYYGEPFGNEEPGFSSVVSRDVLETVEGIMPELMKIFASADQVVEFDPTGPADEDSVEIQGKYINHVFMHRGNGYKVMYDWFKDALLMKNGVLKVGWEDFEEVQFREYAGLTEQEFNLLKEGEAEDAELFATEYEIDDYEEEDDLYRVRLKISRQRGKPICTVIPSEDFRIKERSSSIQDATFSAHVCEKTIGELVEMGYDEDDIEYASRENNETGPVEQARYKQPDETDTFDESEGYSKYDRVVEFIEAYCKMYDPEDERVKIYQVHQVGHTCLDYMEVDRVPMISLSPIMMPHKYSGLAVADLVRDIQEIRSTIYRQMLDNLALQNAGRYTAVEGQVNLQDLIDNRIGGIIRQKMPGAVGRLDTPDLSQYTVPMLEQLSLQKEDRTGVSRMTAGLNENALSSHQTATAVNAVMTAAQAKILLIARNFAETGVKELFVELYNLIREYQTKPDLVPISGRYAIVNPEEWIDRHDVRVTVGIGNGNKDAQLMHLQGISQLLQMIGSTKHGYMITEENVFNLASEFIKNSGYENPNKFITNPANVEPPEPPPNPDLIKAQADAKFKEGTLALQGKELGLEVGKFDWEKKVNAAEVSLEAEQDRPVGVGTGK
jgi:hypothetical protein